MTTSHQDANVIKKVLKSHHDYDYSAPLSVSIYEGAIHSYLTGGDESMIGIDGNDDRRRRAAGAVDLGHVSFSFDTMLHVPAYDQSEVKENDRGVTT